MQPFKPDDFTLHPDLLGIGSSLRNQLGDPRRVARRIAIEQHVRIGTPATDQVRSRIDPYVHCDRLIKVLLRLPPAVQARGKLAAWIGERAIADEPDPRHPDLL